jgi:CubicO group peptidase (beta-lactamase class C family)
MKPSTCLRKAACAIVALAPPAMHAGAPPEPARLAAEIHDLIEPIRVRHHLPGMAGAIVTRDGLLAAGCAGVRKAGTDVPVEIGDQWHLGSDTKAMTAVVIGSLVEQGRLRWDSSIEQVFPGIAPALPASFRKVTLLQLLSHRAGLPHDAKWRQVSGAGSLHEQRLAALRSVSTLAFTSEPGTAYGYSNLGYVIAATMAEQVSGEAWEDLVRRIVFGPLKMSSAGFGGTGTPGKVDQPWPHHESGDPTPRNGPRVDNLPVMAPAGEVHCSIADWAAFVADQLRGAAGDPALLKRGTYEEIQTAHLGGNYAMGWIVERRPWGGGKVLTHSGSNTMNHAVAWVAPLRGFAFLVCCNEGGREAAKACDEATGALIRLREQLAGPEGTN